MPRKLSGLNLLSTAGTQIAETRRISLSSESDHGARVTRLTPVRSMSRCEPDRTGVATTDSHDTRGDSLRQTLPGV